MSQAKKIFSSDVRFKTFIEPPVFSSNDRCVAFELTLEAKKYVQRLQTPENKASFIIQFGYFAAKTQFFNASKFAVKDLNYIYRNYALSKSKFPASSKDYEKCFGGSSSQRYRKKILELFYYSEMTQDNLISLKAYTHNLSENKMGLEDTLFALVQFIRRSHWVVPQYDVLAKLVLSSHDSFEEQKIEIVKEQITQEGMQLLDALMEPCGNKGTLLSTWKSINQSVQTHKLQKNARILEEVKEYFFKNKVVIEQLNMTDAAVKELADRVKRIQTFQLQQLRDKYQKYFHQVNFIIDQYYRRQDAAVTALKTLMSSAIQKAGKAAEEKDHLLNKEKNQAIDAMAKTQKNTTSALEKIKDILDDDSIHMSRKFDIINNIVVNALELQDDDFNHKMDFLVDCRNKEELDAAFIKALLIQARKIIPALGKTMLLLEFDEESSKPKILDAIHYYQKNNGRVSSDAPVEFLQPKRRKLLKNADEFNSQLYKILFFEAVHREILSGALNLKYSYEHRSVDDYQISRSEWLDNFADILHNAQLEDYSDLKKLMSKLKSHLEAAYERINQKILTTIDPYLTMKQGRPRVSTPPTDYHQGRFFGNLLKDSTEISVSQILMEADKACNYSGALEHISRKHVTRPVNPSVAIAGIIGLGCNIGKYRMRDKSIGINRKELINTIDSRFTIKNLRKANDCIIEGIESLDLPNIYKFDENYELSSSDGKKIPVATDSLIANFSFKYFGREKGVSQYTFTDEKQTMFHSTVFSPQDREATYVIDGLLHNKSRLKQIHATDSHGITNPVFGVSFLIDVAFAPRFKRIQDQYIYGFSSKATYVKKGYKILPSGKINTQIIEENWDDILRFVASMKLGVTSAAQLFKRLNSYSIQHPLYQALKEFGKIFKSLHILSYFDDLDFRQLIQKQLNLGELTQKFHDAVFWDRGRKFHVGEKDDQEIYVLCKTIIENCVIFWNYLFLTDLISKCKDRNQKDELIDLIKTGSVISWSHVNFTGNYDFNIINKEHLFNFSKLKKVKIDL